MGKVIIVDAITGDVVEREQTNEEKVQTVADAAEVKASNDARVKAETAKATAKQAVLDKLGLTSDEVAALLG